MLKATEMLYKLSCLETILNTAYVSSYVLSIHPRDKLDVARRLALSSRAVAYQQSNLNFQGPRYTSIQADPSQGTLVIEFDHGNDPIEVRDTTRGFDVSL